jgi:hypothetical protein
VSLFFFFADMARHPKDAGGCKTLRERS